jgi:hypothetical protein
LVSILLRKLLQVVEYVHGLARREVINVDAAQFI